MNREPGQDGARLVYLLRGLPRAADVLHLGSHPDDEEAGLMALLAHHEGIRIVYWSATRGEAGQNRVGPYRAEALGVYRTWEALAARAIAGGECLFGPFYDYGFSKSGEEALEKWGETAVVREIVRAIRYVQPQTVIARWRGDASDGHGHHTAIGMAAKTAFDAAGDATQFPELERAGLVPWQPRRLFQTMMGDYQPGEDVALGVRREDLEGEGCLRLNTGVFDPLVGTTYQEQAAQAFNSYLSQAVGTVPQAGDYYCYLRLVGGAAPTSSRLTGLFDGLDSRLTALADYPGGGSEPLRRHLARIDRIAADVIESFRVHQPWQSQQGLLEFASRLRELRGDLGGIELRASARSALGRYFDRKIRDAEMAAAWCLGLRLEVRLDRARLTPGESARMLCRLWNHGPMTLSEVAFKPQVHIDHSNTRRVDNGGEPLASEYEVSIPSDAAVSCPYWLREPRQAYRYVWPEDERAGRPFDPPLVTVACTVRVAERALSVATPAVYREAFVGGYRELNPSVLPPISVHPKEDRHVLRALEEPQQFDLHVVVRGHHARPPIEGRLEVQVPEAWTADPSQAPIRLQKAGDSDSIAVRVGLPGQVAPGSYAVRYFVRCGERLYDSTVTAVRQTAPGLSGEPDEGSCVQEQFIAEHAVVRVDAIDVAVCEKLRHGYVAGPGDAIPSLLQSLGLAVDVLSDDDLRHGVLDAYDSIVIGPNAYLVRDELRKNARRLLHYAESGGTLIVQYQAYPYEGLGATPYPFRYNQPHDRVTLETRPVRILQPDHFLFRFPNTIGEEDFTGWVRDRGMYFFGEWDRHYQPLLACADPGEEEKRGGLLITSHGKGTFVYIGYTLFRQLAAGVRGGFRLFANLLAIPEARIRQRMGYLRGVPLFSFMNDEDLHAVARIMTERWLEDGEYLCREGEPGDELFIVIDGALDVLQGQPERRVNTCGPGAPLGELAALTDLKRTASLRSGGPTHVLVVKGDAFRAVLRSYPDLSERMLQLLARRLAERYLS